MYKERLTKGLKILIITLLLIIISVLAIMQWKSDLILDKVLVSVQQQLVDSLQYKEATMNWFASFPSITIHISDIRLGTGSQPLIKGGELDIDIGLFPLLKNNIIIKRLEVLNSTVSIINRNDRWTYDIFKKTETPTDSGEEFNTQINQLTIENTRIIYNDGKSLQFNMDISNGSLKGQFEKNIVDLKMEMNATLVDLISSDYKLTAVIPFIAQGDYSYNMNTGLQTLLDWKIEHEGLIIEGGGTVQREKEYEVVDMDITWKNAKPEVLKKYLSSDLLKTWNTYTLSGEMDGQAKIEGKSSEKYTPRVIGSTKLKNGGIDFGSESESIKSLDAEVTYDSGDDQQKQKSRLEIDFKKSAVLGSSLTGKIQAVDLNTPILDISLNGAFPAGLLNLLDMPSLYFSKGNFDIDHFEMMDFKPGSASFLSLFEKGKISFSTSDLEFTYLDNTVVISKGDFKLEDGKLLLDADQFDWNLASATDVKGEVEIKAKELTYTLQSNLCEGKIESVGTLSGIENKPVWNARWKVASIEMEKLLLSFSNFDQTFITSDNLNGKTNIWAESIIPFDKKWNMLTKEVLVKSAIEVTDGRLKDMKTLEDFSKYVHLDDLKDIRFSQIRNYMKIEGGKVYLPVMFIQSSALNLSISGVHSFDQKILYNLKVNAGQTAANKLKKSDVKKDLKVARKSGWINMYFVLEGTTSDVKYQQYRTAVLSGFEQSATLKESLRNYLVDQFGYDVYWLEPNEWEDIPEYK